MAAKMYKWLIIFAGVFIMHSVVSFKAHPYFVSVTEIEHNATDKTLEISCKLFTDDFEKALRKNYKTPIDLLKPTDRTAMNKVVADYVTKRLTINVDGKVTTLQFVGYEQQEEGIVSFYEVKNITTVNKLDITNSVLYDFKPSQINIIHTLVDGNRKSTRLDNPKDKVSFEF
jgi:hypothetical protein